MEIQASDWPWKVIQESAIKDQDTMIRYYDKPLTCETQIQRYSQALNVSL